MLLGLFAVTSGAMSLANLTPSSDKTTNQGSKLIGEFIKRLCYKQTTLEDNETLKDLESEFGNVSQLLCPVPSPEPIKHVIFVEVPKQKVQRVAPKVPQTIVYVLPPEDSHVVRVFDMRARSKPAPFRPSPFIYYLTNDHVSRLKKQ